MAGSEEVAGMKRSILMIVLAMLIGAGIFGVSSRDQSQAAPAVLDRPDSRGEGRPDNQPGDPYDLVSCNGKTEDRDNVLVESAWPPVEFFAGMDWKGRWGIDIQINPFWEEFSFIMDAMGSKNPEPSITAHASPPAAFPGQLLRITTETINFQSNQSDVRVGWCIEDLQKQFCRIFGIVTTPSGRPEDCSGSISVQSLAAGGTLDNLVRIDAGTRTDQGMMPCCGTLSRRPLVDENVDGIDDDWVLRYFGINPLTPFDPNMDVDGDGWRVTKIKKNPLVVPGVKKYIPTIVTEGESGDPVEPPDVGYDPEDQKFQRAPIARLDEVTAIPGRPVDIDVLANDSDVNRNIDPSTLHIAQGSEATPPGSQDGNPEHGIVQVREGGIITYTANLNYEGSDGFFYSICDTTDLCDVWAPVRIAVSSNAATTPAQTLRSPLQQSMHTLIAKARSLVMADAEAAPIESKRCAVPANGISVIGDGCFSNFEEYIWGTNPWDADTDDDGVPDEADIAGTGQTAIPFTWPLQLDIPYLAFRVQVVGVSIKSSFVGGEKDLMKLDSEPIRVYRGQNEPLRVILNANAREVALAENSQVNLVAQVSSPSDLQEGFLDYKWAVSIEGSDPVDLLDCPGGLGANQCIVDIRLPSDVALCAETRSPPAMFCPGQHVEFIVTGTVQTDEMLLTGLPIVPQYGSSSTARTVIDILPIGFEINVMQDDRDVLSDRENPSLLLPAAGIPVEFQVVHVADGIDPGKMYYEWLREDVIDVLQSGVGRNTARYTFGLPPDEETPLDQRARFPIENIQVRIVHLDHEREFSRNLLRVQAKRPEVVVTNPDAPDPVRPGASQVTYGDRPTLEASLQYGRGGVAHRWILDGKQVFEGSSYRVPTLPPGNHTLSIESFKPGDPKTTISSTTHSLVVLDPISPKEKTQFAIAQLSSAAPQFSQMVLLVSIVFGGVFLFFHFLTKAHISVEKKTDH